MNDMNEMHGMGLSRELLHQMIAKCFGNALRAARQCGPVADEIGVERHAAAGEG